MKRMKRLTGVEGVGRDEGSYGGDGDGVKEISTHERKDRYTAGSTKGPRGHKNTKIRCGSSSKTQEKSQNVSF